MKVRITGKNIVYTMASLGGGFLMLFDMKLRFYYIDVLHFDPMMIANAMAIFAIWNAINDPLLGLISDRTKSRMGRRIPYILFCAVPLALSFWFMFAPPMQLLKSSLAQIAFFFVIISLYDTFFTAIYLNWEALFPEMFRDEKVRNRISMFKQGGGIVGAVIATAAAPLIIDRYGYPAMGLVFGVATAATVLLSLLGSHEDSRYSEAQSINLFKAIGATFTNTAFLNVVGASICFETAKSLVLANVDFFGKYVIQDGRVSQFALPVIFVVSLLSFPVWMLINRKGKSERIVILSLLLMLAGLLSLQFVHTFEQMLPGMVLMGVAIAGYFMGRELLFARSIEYDYFRMGMRREGAYFGVNALIIRLSGTVVSYVMGSMLASTGYDSYMKVQPDTALFAIRALIGLIPAVLLAVGLAVSFFYPLKGRRYEEIMQANTEREGSQEL
jgi:glycoside/pentoside/hexuronide:cation symporter, GPH family